MNRQLVRHIGSAGVVLALAGLAACGGSSESPGAVIGQPLADKGLTVFNQTVPLADLQGGEAFPGQANTWDISPDFSLGDGWDDQFDGALRLYVGAGIGSAEQFPYDQTYAELTYFSPTMDAQDGIAAAAVMSDGEWTPMAGSYSAILAPSADTRLQQRLDLAAAVAPIALSFQSDVSTWSGNIDIDPPPYFRVVIRATNGDVLETAIDDTYVYGATVDLSAYAGQSVVLSFEYRSQPDRAMLDDVSVRDESGVEFATNGDFETGNLTGWTASAPAQQPQNMTSGVRTVGGLEVTRSFYTVPNKLWGRWVDVLENNTAAAITTQVIYYTNLGSDDSGVVYYTPNTNQEAIATWDYDNSDRDVGLVFGQGATVDFTSVEDDGAGGVNWGSDSVYFTYDVTVPAGGRIALVQFVVMTGTDTADTAAGDVAARATQVDQANQAIVSGFWSDPQYRDGMTQAQIDAVTNF